ncbi:MAG: hydrogenase iron-sulfur subunit [Rhodothermales bacterium]
MEREQQVVEQEYPKLISPDRIPLFKVDRVSEARAEPPVRGETVLRWFEGFFIRLNGVAQKAMPEALNPFAQMGAVANTTFLIALVTGILLLFWYSPSVNHAYGSVVRMQDSPYLAELLRSLHRYSSDACMLFVVLHGFQTFFARKIGGARWLAWISGIVLIGLLWLDGWTGYWLVWDEAARQIALGTATLLDVLPIFPDPISRSFLTNESVNSLFFFIIFFIHMLIPLAMGVFLWVHIMRLNKSKFFTNKPLSAYIFVTLVGLSLLVPAPLAKPAEMGVIPQDLSVDWYYLLPLFFTDRLQGGVLWIVFLLASVVLFGLPWWLTRRRAEPSVVDEERCNGCTQCFLDCPYNAISLLPRVNGKGQESVVARIDPAKCVGCGICVGSCDSTGIDQGRLPVLDVRRWINHYAGGETTEERRFTAFVCAESAGAHLRLNERGESAAMPGYRIVPVPCVGWVHMLMVERALRHGAQGVLLAGCEADPVCRKGTNWTAERLAGDRAPSLRREKIPAEKVRYVRYDRSDQRAFLEAASAFREGRPDAGPSPSRRAPVRYAVVAAIVLVLAGLTFGLSDAPYVSPPVTQGELVVSFKHAGEVIETNGDEAADQADLLPHMRRTVKVERVRSPVRMKIIVDGEEVVHRAYEPGGLFDDGNSIAVETIPVSEGNHRVQVQIGDTADPEEWTFIEAKTVSFTVAERRVILFDRGSGFTWY